MEFGLSSIGQIAITVSEIDQAIAFYRDKLGMKFLFQVPNMGFFDCGGIRLMLTAAENPGETYSSILYFKVADIQQAQQHTHRARRELRARTGADCAHARSRPVDDLLSRSRPQSAGPDVGSPAQRGAGDRLVRYSRSMRSSRIDSLGAASA